MTETANDVGSAARKSVERFPCPHCHTNTVERRDDGAHPRYECTSCDTVLPGFTD